MPPKLRNNITGFSSDKCAQRNHLAARRDGVNAVPMRFLKSGEVQQFLAQSPHNRGGAGSLPATDAAALALINAKLAKPLTLEQIHIHYIEAANTNFVGDRYLFLDPTTLKNIATDAKAGFAFMNSHRTGGLSHPSELPFGRTFCGRFENYTDEESGEVRQRTIVGFYMLAGVKPNGDGGPSTDDLHAMIDAMTVFDVSVGLYGGEAICDVCGQDLNEYDSDEGWLCPHMPGSTYKMTAEQMEAQKARGVSDGAASYSLTNANCGEVSAVYDGAVPGAGFNKAIAFAKQGGLPDEVLEQLQHAYEALTGSSPKSPFGASRVDKTAQIEQAERPGSPVDNQTRSSNEELSQPRDEPVTEGAAMHEKLGMAFAAALAAVGINLGSDKSGDAAAGAGTPPNPQLGAALNGGTLLAPQVAPAAAVVAPVVAPAVALAATSEPAKLSAEDEARFTKQQEDLTKNEAELAKLREDLEKANKEAADQKAAARLSANKSYIEEKTRNFFLTPAAAEKMVELAEKNPDAFEAIKPSIEANAPVVALAGSGTDGSSASAATALSGQAEGNKLEQLAKDYAKEKGVSYGDAFSAVCSANPELAAAYRAAQPGA